MRFAYIRIEWIVGWVLYGVGATGCVVSPVSLILPPQIKGTSRQQQSENDLVDTLNHVPSLYVSAPSPPPPSTANERVHCVSIYERESAGVTVNYFLRTQRGERGSKSKRMSMVIALSRPMKERRSRAPCVRVAHYFLPLFETHLAVILCPKREKALRVRR